MGNGPTEIIQKSSPAVTSATQPRRWTYAELCSELPETNQPSELWDGELIMSPAPSFPHQEIVLRFYRQLHSFASRHRLGKVITSPVDMVLSPHIAVQPDVAFVSKDRLHIIERAIMGPADLVAEVISLGGRTRDRIEKRDLYEQYGVMEYWILDPEAESVEVLALANGRYELLTRAGQGATAASRLLPNFEVEVTSLFQRD